MHITAPVPSSSAQAATPTTGAPVATTRFTVSAPATASTGWIAMPAMPLATKLLTTASCWTWSKSCGEPISTLMPKSLEASAAACGHDA